MAAPPPKKFMFNNRDFSEQAMEAARQAVKNAPPPPPMFTEAEMETAKIAAHKKGYDEATKEHKESLEARGNNLLDEIARQIQVMITSEAIRQTQYEHDALRLAFAMLDHLYPVLQELVSGEQLLHDAQGLLAQAREMENVIIKVHPEMMDLLSSRFTAMDGVRLSSDATLAINDIALSWPHGGIESMRQDTYKALQDMLREAIQSGAPAER